MTRVPHYHSFFGLHVLLTLHFIMLVIAPNALAIEPPSVLTHHHLIVTLQPHNHSLTAEDTITFHHPVGIPDVLELYLNKNFLIDEIRLNDSIISPEKDQIDIQTQDGEHRLQIPLHGTEHLGSSPSITIRYHGMIDDQPKGTPGLRFTSPDKTTGYIGPEGVYLTSETLWFPTVIDALATFQVRTTVPSGWESVTQGKETSHITSQGQTTSEWNMPRPTEALTLAANQFVKKERLWNGITLATYLFPEDAQLAEQYLDATVMYLDMYTQLLGPYPFSKFAVVENFFPSGIGLPSFTLLGNRIIKRGYTQPYSLGHEIVHSWFGNSVFNHFSNGNWVEGLTTYLSNYYYEEVHASEGTALKKRQQMSFEYNLYATGEKEYPVRKFHHKETRIDNAIGYQKTAMLFHMLRQEVGDEHFFNGIRMLIKKWTEKHADWAAIQQIFTETTGRDLSWFFTQWVDQSGAPSINVAKTEVIENIPTPGQFSVNVTLAQEKPYYRLQVPIVMYFLDGTTQHTRTSIHGKKQVVNILTPARPTQVLIDPDFMVLRRLTRSQMPPMLNTWVTDARQSVWLDEKLPPKEREAYQSILQRLQAQGTEPLAKEDLQEGLQDRSYLILGHPLKSDLGQQGFAGCKDRVEIGNDWISIQGKRYDEPNMAWLISCPHPNNPDHVVSFFHGFSPSAISRVARLLFFYGWDSYLIFQNGQVLTRDLGDPPINHLDVLLDAA